MDIPRDVQTKCTLCEHPERCPISHLAGPQLQEIMETMNSLRYEKGQLIWQEGVYRSGCFVLCSGTAELIVRNMAGRRRIVKSLQSGDIIPCLNGELVGDLSGQFAIQVESTTPVLMHYMTSDSFGQIMIRFPSIAVKVLEALSTTVLELIHEIGVASYCNVQTRMVRFLLLLQEAGQLNQLPSQQVIAEHVGASREAINKAVHTLVEEKIISVHGHDHKIEVLDKQRLLELR